MKKVICYGGLLFLFIILIFFLYRRRNFTGQVENALDASSGYKSKSESATLASSGERRQTSPDVPNASSEANEYNKQVEKKLNLLVLTPIKFYGKVVDEAGNPVPFAEVEASFANKVMANGTPVKTQADASGSFMLSGHGIAIDVMVRKEGYYPMGEKSAGNFVYSSVAGQLSVYEDSNKPAIFILKKKGTVEPLFVLPEKRWDPTERRQPVLLDLSTGRIVETENKSSIKVEAQLDQAAMNSPGYRGTDPVSWKCTLSVPGGSVKVREGELDFVAPEEGYQASDVIDMPASLGDNWIGTIFRNYFIKLGNGNYARIDVIYQMGPVSVIQVTGYYNPSGSRNLEFDPKLQIERK